MNGGKGVLSKKVTGIIFSIFLVFMLGVIILERAEISKNLVVYVGQESYSANDAFVSGIEISANCEGADAIIYMSNHGTFQREDSKGNLEKLGYTIRVSCEEKIYWIPNKLDVGDTIEDAIKIRSVIGVDTFLAYANVQVTRTETEFIPNIIYLGR